MTEEHADATSTDLDQHLGKWMEADHERLDGLWDEAMASWPKDPARSREILIQFRDGLLRHIQVEEDLLFPFFEARGSSADHHLIEFLRDEHTQLRAALQSTEEQLGVDTADPEEATVVLRNVLWAHNTREEGALYPWFNSGTEDPEFRVLSEKIRSALLPSPD